MTDDHERVEDMADAMRRAYAVTGAKPFPIIPWEAADPDKKEEWRACARAALETLRQRGELP